MERDDCTYSDHDFAGEIMPGPGGGAGTNPLTADQKRELQIRGNPEGLLSSLIGTTAVPPDFVACHRDPGDETDHG